MRNIRLSTVSAGVLIALVGGAMGLIPLAAAQQVQVLPGAAPAGNTALSADHMRAQFAQEIPGIFRVLEFVIEAQANMGTPVDPDLRTRFNATIGLVDATFEVVEKSGPFTFVRPVAPPGAKWTLFGRSTSTLRGGVWNTRFDIENKDVVQDVGVPGAMVPGRVIVIGSEDHQKLLAQVEAAQKAKHETELAEQRRAAEKKEVDEVAAGRRAAAVEAAKAEEVARVARQREVAAVALAQAVAREAEASQSAEREEAKKNEFLRTEREKDAVAAAKAAASAETAKAEELAKTADQRKAAAEKLTEALKAEQVAAVATQRIAAETRKAVLDDIRSRLQSPDQSLRLATLDAALKSSEADVQALGFETSWASKDAAMQNLALRAFFRLKKNHTIALYPPAAAYQGDIDLMNTIRVFGSPRLDIIELNPQTGEIAGRVTVQNIVFEFSGSLSRSEIILDAKAPLGDRNRLDYGNTWNEVKTCNLHLKLTDIGTFDGLFRCSPRFPALLARIHLG